MDIQNITLISFGYFEQDLLMKIADSVKLEYHFLVNVKEGHLDLSEFYDSTRRQYDGTRLLKEVDSVFASDSSKTIGLFQFLLIFSGRHF
jgi:archaemetzincin